MKRLIFQIIGNWHHGKGSKFTRKGKFEIALKHFQSALEYALRSDNDASVPIEKECIARTFMRLKNYEEAKKYANESLNLYNKFRSAGSIFHDGANRVSELIKAIEKQQSD